jgi:hypothetical protein
LAILALIVIASNARGDLLDGLIGYWPFDGNGSDASPLGRDLTLQGGVGFAAGLFGQSLDMHKNQSTYAQRLVDDPAYDFGASDFTVQAWANYYSTSTEQVLIEKYTAGTGWTFTKVDDQTVQFYAGGPTSSPSQSLSTGAWHHFLARRAGGKIQIWLDGAMIAVGSIGTIPDVATPLLVGRRDPAESRDLSMNGRLDEVAIWNRAISDSEITHLFNGGAGNPVIPEPSTFALMAILGAAVGFLRRGH